MSQLPALRTQIDQIDQELVQLLEKRAELVLQVKAAKQQERISIYAPEREREIFERVRELAASGNFPVDALERIFTVVLSASRSLIGELRISYLGPESSAAHDAAEKQFGPEAAYFPMSKVEEISHRVEEGEVTYGVVPIEVNSAGIYAAVLEALLGSPLRIVAEVPLVRRLVIAGQSGTALGEIKEIFGDAGSFAQISGWLRINLPQVRLVVEENPAAAIGRLAADRTLAAVTSITHAERAKLSILATGIEGDEVRESRFLVLGKDSPRPSGRDKTSLICSIKERPGALCGLLQPFADENLSLTKIESKARFGRSSEFLFFIEMLGNESQEGFQRAVAKLKGLTAELKVLGSYPAVCA